MAKKSKPFRALHSTAELESRVRKAQREGRTQQALELAKQLQKAEPTPAHGSLLREAYLDRARHLREQGYTRDAASVLEAALAAEGADPAWLEKVAWELAAAGGIRRALDLLGRLPESAARTQILARAADAALRQGKAGRALLPEPLQEPFDRIIQAFGQLEAGQDEAARETLQGIGLQSPFLDWKVLLRGLAAYYQGDDTRALENWQRLSADRLPARLAAPLRFAIDPTFRTAQDPSAQAALQREAERLADPGLPAALRRLQAALARGEDLRHAFRLAEGVLPALRQAEPHLVGRLASCFYWAIIQGGQPEDMNRYRGVFGEPADDPGFARLQALVGEHLGNFAQAHKHWQEFERTVAAHPAAWPGDQARRVRALIWCHMGRNGARAPDEEMMARLPPFLRDHPARPPALKPGPEECFQRSLELAPDQRDAYQELFHYYQHAKKVKKAEGAARQLLARFADDLATLEALADLRVEQQDYAEGLELLQRALKVNPLDRRLRGKLSTTHLFSARAHAEAGRFDAARAEYRTALALDTKGEAAVLCKWAACEFKAGDNARGEELLRQALAKAGVPIGIAFSMLIEATRLKLARPLKARFNQWFVDSLAEPPTAAGVHDVLDTAAVHRLSGVTYYGQKTHEKKVLGYAERARKGVDFSEAQLQGICRSLRALEAMRPLRAFAALGRRQFPANPYFPFVEADSYLAKNTEYQTWRVGHLLDEASGLAAQLPPEDPNRGLLQDIQERRQALRALNPFQALFDSFAGGPFGDGPFGGEDNWEEDDEWAYADDWDEPGPEDFFQRRRSRRRRRR